MVEEKTEAGFDLEGAIALVTTVGAVFAKQGANALAVLDKMIADQETTPLPAPFDKLAGLEKEASTVLHLFLAFDQMVFGKPAE